MGGTVRPRTHHCLVGAEHGLCGAVPCVAGSRFGASGFSEQRTKRLIHAKSVDRTIVALAFAVRRDHPQYATLSLDEQADTIANACGAFGSSCEYLMKTREALAAHGVADRYLDSLADAVVERQRAARG